MTLTERAAAFATAFPSRPASWPRLVREKNRGVLYATWVIGNDYRNKTRFYGSYPNGYLARLLALFPDVDPLSTLHVFSGSLPPGNYVRFDVNASLHPDVVGSVYDVAALLPQTLAGGFQLVCADPPYSKSDAEQYGTPMINRHRATKALAAVVPAGGHLAWLDTCWPMHNKTTWLTVGRILVQRSTNHRVRLLSIFERVGA